MVMIAVMVRDTVATGLMIAKRRTMLNRTGDLRIPAEPPMRQEDLAARLGVAPSTVANWERGKSYPVRYLGALEAVLGISLTSSPEVQPEPEVQPDLADPAEALIWRMTRYSEQERREFLLDLRATRRAGTGTG